MKSKRCDRDDKDNGVRDGIRVITSKKDCGDPVGQVMGTVGKGGMD